MFRPIAFCDDTRNGWVETLAGALIDKRESFLGKYHLKNRLSLLLKVQSAQSPVEVEWAAPSRASDSLTVLIGGIFGTPKGTIDRGIAKILYQSNQNLLVLPNSWAAEVIKKNLNFVPGNILKEHRFTVELIEEFLKIKKLKPRTINIVGISYGGFLTPGVRSELLNKKYPGGNTVLVAPPLDFSFALSELDQIPNRAKSEINCEDRRWMDDVAFAQLFATGSEDISNDIRRCVFTILSKFSFGSMLKKTVNSLGESKAFKGSFKSYLETYQNVCVADLEDRCFQLDRLEGWLLALAKRGAGFTVITSHNDPLNDPAEWFLLDQGHPEWDLVFFRTGGHAEFWHDDYFTKLLIQKTYN